MSFGELEREAHLAISQIVLNCAGLENTLGWCISNILFSEDIRTQYGKIDISTFSEKDKKLNSRLRERLNQTVKLIGKVDSKERYIKCARRLQTGLLEAIVLRNAISHGHVQLPHFERFPYVVFNSHVKVEDFSGGKREDPITFALKAQELIAVAKFLSDSARWFGHCSIEIMYDYGHDERQEKPMPPFEGFPIWPESHRKPPYPWNTYQRLPFDT